MQHTYRRCWLLIIVLALCCLPAGGIAQAAPAQQCAPHVVQAGETLSGIAAQHGVSATELAQANGIADPNLIYAGQQLVMPGCGSAPVAAAPVASQTVHVVQAGETLSGIAAQYGTSVAAIAQANGIADPSAIYAGQRLVIPAGAGGVLTPAGNGGAKLIEINLSQQMLYAYEGGVLVLSSGVSTGRPGWDTPPGNFAVYAKYEVQTMRGTVSDESWLVPDVPHVMYFWRGDALHGTYWHNSFGTGARLSHGCVNLPLDVAAQLFRWAPIGTPVQVHW